MRRARRYTAQQALVMIRDMDPNISEEEDNSGSQDIACIQSDSAPSSISSDSEEETSINLPSLAERVGYSPSVENTVSTIPIGPTLYPGKDGTQWSEIGQGGNRLTGRKSFQNVRHVNAGVTSFAAMRVSESPYSAFKLLFNEPMLRHVHKCTLNEAIHQRVSDFNMSLEELETFIGLCYARGAVSRNVPVKDLWSPDWGAPIFRNWMSKNRYESIMRFLRFDEKSQRKLRLESDKFALASALWDPFIENCKKAFIPGENLTVDEQLFPTKSRCPFTQYIASKPDKFGLKFFLSVDLQTKYICNGFPYLGKDHTRPSNQPLPNFVVQKLIDGFERNGHNITCDNYFTSLKLTQDLANKGCSLVGTIRKNRRELPDIDVIMKKRQVFDSCFFSPNFPCETVLTAYKCKKNKVVCLLSSTDPDTSKDDTEKKKPNIIHFYNHTKCGVDNVDQMLRQLSTRCQTRRWPMSVFYNILDMCALNAWIIYKSVNKSSISRRDFQLSLLKELCSKKFLDSENSQSQQTTEIQNVPLPRKRAHCSFQKCKNMSATVCIKCRSCICGKHSDGTKISFTTCQSCTES